MEKRRVHNQLRMVLHRRYIEQGKPIPSLRALEKKTGVGFSTIHAWLRDEPMLMLDTRTVVKFCEAFGCRLEELLSVR